MKSSLEQTEVSLSTTTEGKTKLQVKENNHLFNHIGKLAADHDVTVSNTMIKITYKKALKDQNSVDSMVDCNTESDFSNGNNKPTKPGNLCNNDISFIVKSPKMLTEGNKVFHSTPKQTVIDIEKKKYVNGLNLTIKPNNSEGMSSVGKVQKTTSSQEDASSSPKKLKIILNKQTLKPELEKRFLKGNGLVKPKTSIIQRNVTEGKKVKLAKGSDKKIKKLENGVKKKTVVDKKTLKIEGVKRKVSSTEYKDLVKYKKMKINESKVKQSEGSRGVEEANRSGSKKPIMLVDPDLPTGWTRFIRTKNKGTPNEQYVVYVVNPQGKKFRFKWKLRKYLQRTNSSLDVDQFFFGLYQRPKTSNVSASEKSKKNEALGPEMISPDDLDDESEPDDENDITKDFSSFDPKMDLPNAPMYDDPNLPEGWKRFIKIRSCGESAGRMEVVIVSPEGRRHRTRKHLEHYFAQKRLNYNPDDFDFTVFGRKRPSSGSAPEPEPEQTSNDVVFLGLKKKFTDKPVPELDINSIKEPVVTPEGRLINTVTGLTLSSGLSTIRNERRQRLPRREHEKQLKTYLSTEEEFSFDGCQIPTHWVERLVKCRADFRILEPDAALTIAEATKEFLKNLSLLAVTNSEQPDGGLRYEDIAELVDSTEGLSFLKTLIPKKITFREFVKLNRPKQFMSFT